MKHQILIASYHKDFIWLKQCLRSLKKFCVDPRWLPPVIAVTNEDVAGVRQIMAEHFPGSILSTYSKRPGFENLAAQNAMMHADVMGTGDVMWLVGSDCIAVREMNPDHYMCGDKPRLTMNSYAAIGPQVGPWRAGVYKALGVNPEFEFMRRLPLLYPRALFGKTRDAVAAKTKKSFTQWLFQTHNKGTFSESNLLGAYAYHFAPHFFHWENLDIPTNINRNTNGGNPLSMLQFWSHGGVDHPVDCKVDFLDPTLNGQTPRFIVTHLFGSFIP